MFGVLFTYFVRSPSNASQGTHDIKKNNVIITSNDVATSFWRDTDVIIASCARWAVTCLLYGEIGVVTLAAIAMTTILESYLESSGTPRFHLLVPSLQINYRDFFNSLGPSDVIWRQWSWTTLAQVMACCLTAPNHYLNQCWLIIIGVLYHSSENSFAGIAQGINSGHEFEKDILKIIFKSPRGQWVNT